MNITGSIITSLPGLILSNSACVVAAAMHILERFLSVKHSKDNNNEIIQNKNVSKLYTKDDLNYSITLKEIFEKNKMLDLKEDDNIMIITTNNTTTLSRIPCIQLNQTLLKSLLKGVKHVLNYLKTSDLFSSKYVASASLVVMIKHIDEFII